MKLWACHALCWVQTNKAGGLRNGRGGSGLLMSQSGKVSLWRKLLTWTTSKDIIPDVLKFSCFCLFVFETGLFPVGQSDLKAWIFSSFSWTQTVLKLVVTLRSHRSAGTKIVAGWKWISNLVLKKVGSFERQMFRGNSSTFPLWLD